MKPDWVTFDCFGTLVDWHGGFEAILWPLAWDRTEELIAAYHEFEPREQARLPHPPYRQVLTNSLRLAAAKIGLPLTEAQVTALPDNWDRLRAFGDVEPMLKDLRYKGWKLAVLTNCDEDLFGETEWRFVRAFDLVVTAERVKSYKPALGHFHEFARLTGCTPANWVHVASSWFHDIEPTAALGLRRIWLNRDLTEQMADANTVEVFTAEEICLAIKRL